MDVHSHLLVHLLLLMLLMLHPSRREKEGLQTIRDVDHTDSITSHFHSEPSLCAGLMSINVA